MKIYLLILFFAVLLPGSLAQEYYADLNLDVQSDGTVLIEGITNEPSLAPGSYNQFTSKKGAYWLLNITSDKEFSDYIVTVKLPQGTEFNYLKTSGRSRISYDDGIKIVISGTDSFDLLVQYRIETPERSLLALWFTIVGVGVFILAFFAWNKIFKHKLTANVKGKQETKQETISSATSSGRKSSVRKKAAKNLPKMHSNDSFEQIKIIKKTLAESQEKIIDTLIEADGELVQKQLQHRTALPKATLSRNLDILSRKGIITKQSRGMTNMIILNKELKEK